jgi:hypothetical protein
VTPICGLFNWHYSLYLAGPQYLILIIVSTDLLLQLAEPDPATSLTLLSCESSYLFSLFCVSSAHHLIGLGCLWTVRVPFTLLHMMQNSLLILSWKQNVPMCDCRQMGFTTIHIILSKYPLCGHKREEIDNMKNYTTSELLKQHKY